MCSAQSFCELRLICISVELHNDPLLLRGDVGTSARTISVSVDNGVQDNHKRQGRTIVMNLEQLVHNSQFS